MASKMALRTFEQEYQSDIPAYFVDLIQNRELSNFIAETTSILHQSPQVIAIKGGEVKYAESHYHISAKEAINL